MLKSLICLTVSLTDQFSRRRLTRSLLGEEVEVVFSPAPENITEDTDGELRIHDLPVFTGERVVAIAYLDAESEWSVIADEDGTDGDSYEVVYGELVEHRGYKDVDREDAMQWVITKQYGIHLS